MKAQLEQRLEELKAEYESGQKILKDIENALYKLETRKKKLEETLLRISGAVEVLEEVLGIPEEAARAALAEEVGVGKEETQREVEGGAEASSEARRSLAGESSEVLGKREGHETAEAIEVPNVIKISFEKAREMLEAAGLQVGEVSEKSIFVAGIRFGHVIRQSPGPGKKISPGDTVDLVLAAKGKFKPVLSRDSKLNAYSTH